ncbi:hypothetical protein BVH03_12330 [Pseudomonas sp. PA15(2017)]|uniref:hypothetical protein n=1 Tax=Pseudomonas sp. PA15(2017) TaxID=1932111 RepID=UPI000963399C|nr:hypothetical protein [Pseudomonas sp. PA15(2017)]OLU28751.1 hypothetical protein BVH03_12330 [Pseudomonas sp. PA15(2017)]
MNLFTIFFRRDEQIAARQNQPFADSLWERAMRAKNRGHGPLPQILHQWPLLPLSYQSPTNLGGKIINRL